MPMERGEINFKKVTMEDGYFGSPTDKGEANLVLGRRYEEGLGMYKKEKKKGEEKKYDPDPNGFLSF